MKKNISHITEELMVDYLENNLSNQDKKKFEEILSSNEYLKERVDSLREIISEQPLESVPVDVHNDILEKLNIKTDKDSARKRKNHFLDKMIDYLTARPILLASSISCLVIFFMTLSFLTNFLSYKLSKLKFMLVRSALKTRMSQKEQ